jgi:hypothetical protein
VALAGPQARLAAGVPVEEACAEVELAADEEPQAAISTTRASKPERRRTAGRVFTAVRASK